MRLVLMSRFGMDLPAELIEQQVATALDLIVMSKRLSGGERRITSLSEVSMAPGGGVHLEECVSYDEGRDGWRLVRMPGFLGRAASDGLIEREEVRRWRTSLS